MKNKAPAILFYDGDCGLCNRVVQFVLRFEKSQEIQFAKLNSSFTENFFLENGGIIPDGSTVLLYSNYHIYKKSGAALQLLSYLKWPFQLLKLFHLFPVCWRDRLYDWVAKNRIRWFSSYCVIPSKEDEKRFIA